MNMNVKADHEHKSWVAALLCGYDVALGLKLKDGIGVGQAPPHK